MAKIQNTNYKLLSTMIQRIRLRTWISIGLITILLPIIAFVLYSPSATQAEWYDDSFLHRQEFSFIHNANISSPRSITFTLDTAELIAAGVMQSDCDDTRFTDIDGNFLQYELTGTCNNASTTYEVIFEKIINGTNVGYVYYGNSTAINREANSSIYTALTPSGGDPSAITDRTAEETTDGPVAYWKFDEAVGNTCANGTDDACDSSGQGNDGTFGASTAAPTIRKSDVCLSEYCLEFDGSDDVVSFSNSAEVSSVSFWIKIFSDSTTEEILDLNGTDYLTSVSGTLTAAGFGTETIYVDGVSGTTSLTVGKWHHVAVTTASTLSASSIKLANVSAAYGNIMLDEVKLYSGILTANQIRQDYMRLASSNSLSNGLVGYWPFDESGADSCSDGLDSCDYSGFGNNTTWTGTLADIDPAKFGNGLLTSFTGHYSKIEDNSLYEVENVTISVWVYPTASQTGRVIMGKRYEDAVDPYNSYMLATDGAAARFTFCVSSGTSGSQTCIDDTENYTINTWYHLVGTYDGEKSRFYKDGVLVAETDFNGPLGYGTGDFYLGGFIYSSSSLYATYDDARVYSRAFSPAEVKSLYNWAPGPVAYWGFDEKAGQTVYETSGNGLNGRLGSTTGTDTSDPTRIRGKYGGALEFDGSDDHVYTADDDLFDIGTQATYQAWVNPSAYPANGSYIIAKHVQGAEDKIFYMHTNGAIFCNFVNAYGTSLATTVSMPLNTWTHVACVYDRNTAYVYINGYLNNAKSASGDVLDSTGNVYFGRSMQRSSGANDYYNGKLDEVMFYNYARVPSQIIQDVNGGHPVGGSPVGSQLAYWKFDEGFGDTAYDSVNSYNGNLEGTCPGSATCPSVITSGKFSRALSFDGGDNVNIDTVNSAISTTQGTVSLWAKMDPHTGNGAMYSSRVDSNNNIEIFWNEANGTVDLKYKAAGTESIIQTSRVTDADSNWHHYILTWDTTADQVKAYIDGIQVGTTQTGLGTWAGSISTSQIGASGNPAGSQFKGDIDEVKIYSTALTAEQVLIDYNANSAIRFGEGTGEDTQTIGSSVTPAVARWDFEEKTGTTAYDTSINSFDATLTNMEEIDWIPAKYGTGLDLDGSNEHLSIGDNFDLSSSTTYSAWIKVDDLTTTGQRIFVKDDSGNSRGYAISIGDGGTGLIRFFIRELSPESLDSNTAITVGEWYHIVASYSTTSARKRIYINGRLDAEQTGHSGILENNTNSLGIGGDPHASSGNYLDGIIDQFKIFNYELTPQQVAYEYNRGLPVAHWKLDECQGATAYDSSGNDNNGTITSGAVGNTATGSCGSGTSTEMWDDGTNGKFNGSLGFDGGDDYVKGTAQIVTSYPFTFSLWVNTNDLNGEVIYLGDENGTSHMSLSLISGTASITARSSGTQNIRSGNTTINDNSWHNITGVFVSATERKLYVNGVLENTGTTSISFNSGIDTFCFATGDNCTSTATNEYSGLIDDVRIYNYAVAEDQIKVIMNQGAAARFGE